MTLSLNTLKPAHGSTKKSFAVGRGHGSGKGKTSGRGTKGQSSRSGVSGLKLKGFRALMLSMPKSRGFVSQRIKDTTITLGAIAQAFPKEAKINLDALREKGLISKGDISAKIVGTGSIKTPVHVFGIKASAGAKEAIEKAGGSVRAPKNNKKKASKKK